jgi:membrane-bound lytic murein transglycosylase B
MLLRFCLILLLTVTSTVFADTNFSHRPQVKAFIQTMVKKHHFSEAFLVRIFNNVKIRPNVIRSVNMPLEQKPWYDYQRLFVTEWRIREGVKFWDKYHAALMRAQEKFGVPAEIIVATIGVETKYGRRIGDFRVIDALSNLAFNNDSKRSGYFKNELQEFLLLTREQKLNPFQVLGSYAGAMGQPQFMPSSYRRYAINFSGDNKIDLTHNEIDVIGSIANYYNKHGWKSGQRVVMPASLQTNSFALNLSSNSTFSTHELQKYGIIPNLRLPHDLKVKIIELYSYAGKEYWLGFHNFGVIKRYNNSNLYAMAVYQLSYYISALRENKKNV